jgi:hypothetical protein
LDARHGRPINLRLDDVRARPSSDHDTPHHTRKHNDARHRISSRRGDDRSPPEIRRDVDLRSRIRASRDPGAPREGEARDSREDPRGGRDQGGVRDGPRGSRERGSGLRTNREVGGSGLRSKSKREDPRSNRDRGGFLRDNTEGGGEEGGGVLRGVRGVRSRGAQLNDEDRRALSPLRPPQC